MRGPDHSEMRDNVGDGNLYEKFVGLLSPASLVIKLKLFGSFSKSSCLQEQETVLSKITSSE